MILFAISLKWIRLIEILLNNSNIKTLLNRMCGYYALVYKNKKLEKIKAYYVSKNPKFENIVSFYHIHINKYFN